MRLPFPPATTSAYSIYSIALQATTFSKVWDLSEYFSWHLMWRLSRTSFIAFFRFTSQMPNTKAGKLELVFS